MSNEYWNEKSKLCFWKQTTYLSWRRIKNGPKGLYYSMTQSLSTQTNSTHKIAGEIGNKYDVYLCQS